jgi:TolB-like protein
MYRKPFRPSQMGLHALVLALVVLLVAPDQGNAADGPPKLLLLPIVVHSAEDPEYVRNGLADMLISRFSRIGGLELVRQEDTGPGTTDRVKALALGRKAGADFVLYGSFTRFGQGASLDVQCLPTDESKGRTPLREIFVHSGSIGEIIPDLDDLAGKVSRFAKGENVSTAPATASGTTPAASPDLQELIDRVEALEAAITQILDEEVDIEMEIDESSEELR